MRPASVGGVAIVLAAGLLGPTPAAATTAPPTSSSVSAPAAAGTRAAASVGAAGPVSTWSANRRIARVLTTRTVSPVLGPRFTMTVWDTSTSRYVFKKRQDASLRGASTTKVLTAVGALANLGAGHRFPTLVRPGASPTEVVLVAGGDPMLTSADLRGLAARTVQALAERGGAGEPITVRADDSLFSGPGQSRGWPDSYLPGEVRPVGAFARDDREVRDATADAGAFFAAALRARGLAATYAGPGTAQGAQPPLATFEGHTLAEALSRMLLVSDNDVAEMLFRHIAVARGLPGTWAGARQAQADTLRSLRVPLAGVRIVDGSGLSLEGRLTAYALTSALNRALSTKHPRLRILRWLLPVAGRTGTLKASNARFSTAPARCAAGRIQAKTGTVADAVALAGYATGADGRTKIFVSVVNGRPTRYSRVTTRKAVDRAAASVTGCW